MANRTIYEDKDFIIQIDSIAIDQIDYVISLCSGDSMKEIYRLDAFTNEIKPVTYKELHGNKSHVFLVSELLVGYDYYIILTSKPLRIFISDHIEYFELEDNRTWYIKNIDKKYITIYVDYYHKTDKIKLKEIPL